MYSEATESLAWDAYRARCRERETLYGGILDRMTVAEVEALATRKYCYAPALHIWQDLGRPMTGRHREDLLHQLATELNRSQA